MLQGVYPALPTPFSNDGMRIEWEKLGPLCESLLEDGVEGFFVCGTTGEAPYLTAEEKIRMFEETLRISQGRGKILAHVGCGDWPGTVKVIQEARRLGVDALSILQPWFFRCDDEAQYQYLARAAEVADGFPLYLYNLPCFSGNNLNPVVVERLCKRFPNIQGLKESGSPELIQRWYPYQSNTFQVICGNDTQMLRTLCHGGRAVVASTANVLTKTFRALFSAVRENRWEDAEKEQDRINRFVQIIDGPNGIAHIKASLALKGLDAGCVRPPNRNLTPEEYEKLRAGLNELGVI